MVIRSTFELKSLYPTYYSSPVKDALSSVSRGLSSMHLRGSPPPAVDCEPGGRNLGMDMDGAVEAPVEVEEEEKSEIEKLREENTKLKEEVARLSDKGRFVPLSADLLEHNPQFKRAAPRLIKPFMSAAELRAFEGMLRPMFERARSWPGPKKAGVMFRPGDDGTCEYGSDDSELSNNFDSDSNSVNGVVTDDMYEDCVPPPAGAGAGAGVEVAN